MVEQSVEIHDVQSLNSDGSATVESFNNSGGGRRRIVKLAVAGLAVAAVAIGLGVGIGLSKRGQKSASTSASQFSTNAYVKSSRLDCAGESGGTKSGKQGKGGRSECP